MVQPISSVLERAQQMNIGLFQNFCVGESYPSSSHPGSRQVCSSPNVPDFFQAVPRARVQREWVQVSLCRVPLRGTAWDFTCLHVTQPHSLLVFTARRCGDFSSCHWNPGLGGLVWGRDPILLRETSTVKTSLSILNCPIWVCDQPILRFCPMYPLLLLVFNSLAVGLSFS